jgi:hypothetical protein
MAGPEPDGRVLLSEVIQQVFHRTVVLTPWLVAMGGRGKSCDSTCPADIAALFGEQRHNFSLVNRAYHFFAITFLAA